MNFEDTNLPDTPDVRAAFRQVSMLTAFVLAHNPDIKPNHSNPASQSLRLRAGEIMYKTDTKTDTQKIAAAMLFLTDVFSQPVPFKRGHSDTLPKVVEWAEEFFRINRGLEDPRSASPELNQVITAAYTALFEGYKQDFNDLSPWEVDAMHDMIDIIDGLKPKLGDTQLPELDKRFNEAREDLESLLSGNGPDDYYRFGRPGF